MSSKKKPPPVDLPPGGDADLPTRYHAIITACIAREGVFPHQAMTRREDGHLGLHVFDLHAPTQVLLAVADAKNGKGVRETIFGTDRFAKPGQGTTLGDLIAGAYHDGGRWKTFVIEYRHRPRLVLPLCWDNAFWNAAIRDEMAQIGRSLLGDRAPDEAFAEQPVAPLGEVLAAARARGS